MKNNYLKTLCLIVGCWCGIALATAQSATRESSTRGNDFWGVFMDNSNAAPDAPSLTFTIYIISDTAVDVTIDIIGMPSIRKQIASVNGGVDSIVFNNTDGLAPQAVYISGNSSLNETGQVQNRSFHIHNTDPTDSRVFSCIAFNKYGEPGYIAQDASLLIPKTAYGKEYVIQTYAEDTKSTEFVVVATEDYTDVQIMPATPTLSGSTGDTYPLMRGQSVMVASQPTISLSGSQICANKPVAVFSGNQSPKIPFADAYSAGYAFEQALPIDYGNTLFYLALPDEGIMESHFDFISLYPNTNVTLTYNSDGDPIEETYTNLNIGKSMDWPGMLLQSSEGSQTDVVIRSDKPIICTQYMTSGAANQERIKIGTRYVSMNWGNPADAHMMGWESHVTSARIVTKNMTPKQSAGWTPDQKHLVHLIVPTAEINMLQITSQTGENISVDPSAFTSFLADPSMSYGSVLLSQGSDWFDIKTTGQGFVGYVYGMTDGIGYQYTLDFNPYTNEDSLFIQNPEEIMSEYSYDTEELPYMENKGWYQRQLKDWAEKEEARLDTAYVCDSTTLNFMTQLNPTVVYDSIIWRVFKCDINGEVLNPLVPDFEYKSTNPAQQIQQWDYQFILDPQKDLLPKDRDPYTLYQLQNLLIRKHIICPDLEPERDTLKTMVHVNRIYNDTILKRMLCVTDSVKCFYDDVTHTTIHDAALDSTTFISKDANPTGAYQEGFDLGYNVYRRDYKTIFGCDSIMYFELYVCDTQRVILDTTICENEPLKFEGSQYFQNTNFDHEGQYLDTIKTVGCNEMKAQYDPDNLFHGCDSIFEVNLHICDTFMIYTTDTFCSNGYWELPYEWHRDGRLNPDSLVRTIYFRESDMNKIFEFRDTVKTLSCPDCDKGGCDSIFVLNLFVAPYYIDSSVVVNCGQHYNPDKGELELIPYSWEECTSATVWDKNQGRRISKDEIQNTALDVPNVFIDSLLSVNGCDSISVLSLTRHNAFLDISYHRMANNETYVWRGKTYGPLAESTQPYIFHDSILLGTIQGCDSIYRLELTIGRSFEATTSVNICDDSTFVWDKHTSTNKYDGSTQEPRQLWDRTRGKIVYSNQLYGSKVNEGGYPEGEYDIVDSLKMNVLVDEETIQADSIWILHLTVHPTYRKDEIINICDNDTVTWQGTLYVGNQFKGTPAQASYQTLSAGSYPFERHYNSQDVCDSAFFVTVNVHKTFYQEEDSTVCQGDPFVWTMHEGHPLVDEDGAPVQTDHVTDEYGEYTFIDHLYNTECTTCTGDGKGCDSIFELHVTVNPSYKDERTVIFKDTVCATDVPYVWADHDATKFTFSTSTTVNDTITTALGCDSVVTLQLTVLDNTDKETTITLCQNSPAGEFGVQKHPFSPKDSVPGTYTFVKRLTVKDHCSYNETLTIHLHPTYLIQQYDTICQDTVNSSWEWTGREGRSVYSQSARQRIASTAIPVNVAGNYIYVDSTLTRSCPDCPESGCDSIMTLHLLVLPSYHFDTTACMSDEETLTWEGVTYGGLKTTDHHDVTVTKDTVIVWSKPTIGAGTRHCDSIRVLHLRIGKVFRDTLRAVSCGNEPYTWIGKNQAGQDSIRQVIQPSQWGANTSFSTSDNHKTKLNFDSIYYLELTILPYYLVTLERTHTDSICQGSTYEWTDHNRHLYLTDKHQWIENPSDYVATLPVGLYTFHDSIGTKGEYSCDSVWALQLRVDSVYNQTAEYTICENDTLHWENRLYVGQYFEGTYNEADYNQVFKDLPAQEAFTDDTVYHTIHGCDSTWNLILHIRPSYPVVKETDTTYVHICDNETYKFVDDITYNTGGEWVISSHAEGDNRINRQVLLDTIPSLAFGCDSAVAHVIYIHPTYLIQQYDTVCQDTVNSSWEWTGREGRTVYSQSTHQRIAHTAIPVNVAGNYIYVDSTLTRSCPDCPESGCDSIMTLHLLVLPSYQINIRRTMSDEDSIHWEGTTYMGTKCPYTPSPDETVVIASEALNTYAVTHRTHKLGTYSCDSTRILTLRIGKVFRDTTYDFVCDNCIYEWQNVPTQDGGTKSVFVNGKDIPNEYTYRYDSLTTVLGFDSIYVLKLFKMPTYRHTLQDTVCQSSPYEWAGHEHHTLWDDVRKRRVTTIATDEPGWYTFVDSLKTQTYFTDPHIQHSRTTNCDSVWTLTLYVPPTYRIPESLTICDNDTVRWQHRIYAGDYFRDSTLLNQMVAEHQIDTFIVYTKGAHKDSVRYTSQFGCDSMHVLHLDVLETHRTYLHHELGDNNTTWSFCPSGDWSKDACHKGEDFHVLDYTDPTRPDRHFLFIDTVKNRWDCDSIIYDSVDVYPSYRFDTTVVTCSNATFNWRKYQNLNHQPSGIYYDSLKTVVHGVDSVYVLHLTIIPSVEYSQSFVLCEDDTLDWQYRKIYYRPEYQHQPIDVKASYQTEKGCDSIYNLHVSFCRDYDFYDTLTICSSDSVMWRGKWYSAAGDYADSLTTVTCPDCLTGGGCDSVYHLTLYNYPTYAFHETDTVCRDTVNSTYTWTNRHGDVVSLDEPISIHQAGTFLYRKQYATSQYSCDSSYYLSLVVLPTYEMDSVAVICDNDSIVFHGKKYVGNKAGGEYAAGVYTDTLRFLTTAVPGHACDSNYIFGLIVYPTYDEAVTTYHNICDNETYDFHGHIYNTGGEWVSPSHEVQTFNLDSIIASSHGCDSAVQHVVTVHPTYRIVDNHTICSNETFTWHNRSYRFDNDTLVHDSIELTTQVWGCDSIHCLNLTVNQAYAFQTDSVICADRNFTFTWHNTVQDITVLPNTQQSFSFYDSLTTRHTHCDSIFHLDLTVCAFQYDTVYDTICTGDTYLYKDSTWTHGGTYQYLTFNRFNCPEITTIYLTEIPPTLIRVKALDVCADAPQLKVAFTFSGKRPRSYKVDYSTYAEQHGFSDIDRLPLTDDTLYLDMPYRSDRLSYIRPDAYSAKLFFQGVCIDSTLTSQQIQFTVRYPGWIIPQHWNDAINILAPELNGGYEFDAYQWFINDIEQIGETKPYYYNPHYLQQEARYSVALRRVGEDYFICSCEMIPNVQGIDPVMPSTPYVAVVPTAVVKENPVVNILSVSGGDYELYDIYGSLYTKGSYDNLDHNAFQVRLPSVEGTYVFRLYDRGAGQREVKILVH